MAFSNYCWWEEYLFGSQITSFPWLMKQSRSVGDLYIYPDRRPNVIQTRHVGKRMPEEGANRRFSSMAQIRKSFWPSFYPVEVLILSLSSNPRTKNPRTILLMRPRPTCLERLGPCVHAQGCPVLGLRCRSPRSASRAWSLPAGRGLEYGAP